MAKISLILKMAMIFVIKCYRCFIGPFFYGKCRFYPTCSEYALLVIEKHGIMKGGLLTVKRLLKCHPWHEGGCDFG